jgi:hypothetical protein
MGAKRASILRCIVLLASALFHLRFQVQFSTDEQCHQRATDPHEEVLSSLKDVGKTDASHRDTKKEPNKQRDLPRPSRVESDRINIHTRQEGESKANQRFGHSDLLCLDANFL